MSRANPKRRDHLRLVEPPVGQPPILTNPEAREEFERLSQRLFDIVVEIMDLADGDPDLEIQCRRD